MELLVTNFGSFLGKKSERLVLKENGKVVNEIPFHDLEQVIIDTAGTSLSTDVIRECMENEIQISFLTPSGKPYAKLVSPYLTGTVITRCQQLLAFLDERGIALAKLFIEGKLKNQVNVLKYFAGRSMLEFNGENFSAGSAGFVSPDDPITRGLKGFKPTRTLAASFGWQGISLYFLNVNI